MREGARDTSGDTIRLSAGRWLRTTQGLERDRSGGLGPRITVPSVSKTGRIHAASVVGMVDAIEAPLVVVRAFLRLVDAAGEAALRAARGFDPRGEYVGGAAQFVVCAHAGV